MSPVEDQFTPKRWTALTWLAIMLWAWEPVVLNLPPRDLYAVDPITGELGEPVHYGSLTELPIPVGWPWHYVRQSNAFEPVIAQGAAPPAPVPPTIAPQALIANVVLVLATILAVVYLLQRFLFQYSLRTLLIIVFAATLSWSVGGFLVRFTGVAAAGRWFAMINYFWPLPVAVGIFWLGSPRTPKFIETIRRRDPRQEPSSYKNAEDALGAAVRLDRLGDWDAAIDVYRYVAERWPEHQPYARSSIDQVVEKQRLAQESAS